MLQIGYRTSIPRSSIAVVPKTRPIRLIAADMAAAYTQKLKHFFSRSQRRRFLWS